MLSTTNSASKYSVFSAGKAAALACCFMVLAPPVLAMRLGDAITASELGSTLNVEIPLTEANGWRDDQINVALSGDASEIIRNLTVTLQPAPGGYQIVVRSSTPLREPYLALTVSVRWPNGNLQRAYEILLDPPSARHNGY